MSQFLRPISNRYVPPIWSYTGAGYYQSIDEASPNDADYIWSDNGANNVSEFYLTPADTPQAGNSTLRIRAAKTRTGSINGTGGSVTFRVSIYEDGVPAARYLGSLISLTGSWTTHTIVVDLSAVADWTKVYAQIQVVASVGDRGGGFSWFELEAPDSGNIGTLAATGTPDTLTSSGMVNNGPLGALAATEAADVFAATGSAPASGLLVATGSPDRFNSPAARDASGYLAASEAPDVSSILGSAVLPEWGGSPYACMRCGFEVKEYELRKEWTGNRVCKACFDPKPEDLKAPKLRPEGIPKRSSPEPQPRFVGVNEITRDML